MSIKKIYNNIEFLRLQAGLTRAQLADRVGTTETSIYRKERGVRKLGDKELDLYAKALNCRSEQLITRCIASENGESGELKSLGKQVTGYASPDEAVIETVRNPHADTDYVVRFTCPEFTSICPVTGQPDFAHIVIDYVPGKSLVESKSLKLFLGSFRNHGAFHEDCTVAIAKRLIKAAKPKWLRIGGYWYPRGGIPIDVFYQYGELPEGLWVPDTGVAPYRGRS